MKPFRTPVPRRAALRAALVAAALALAGCAGLQPLTTEQIVGQRAEARWDELIKGDFEQAWAYTQPGFRAIVKSGDYRKRFGSGQWLGAQIHQVKCQAERCTVSVRLTSRILAPKFAGQDIVGYVEETWVREDGQWWYYQAL